MADKKNHDDGVLYNPKNDVEFAKYVPFPGTGMHGIIATLAPKSMDSPVWPDRTAKVKFQDAEDEYAWLTITTPPSAKRHKIEVKAEMFDLTGGKRLMDVFHTVLDWDGGEAPRFKVTLGSSEMGTSAWEVALTYAACIVSGYCVKVGVKTPYAYGTRYGLVKRENILGARARRRR